MTTETIKGQGVTGGRWGAVFNTSMSTQTLYRLGGIAVLAGGVAGALSEALHPSDPEGPAALVAYAAATQPVHLLMFVGVIGLLLGLPAVYVRQSQKTGIFGLVAFVMLFFGLALLALPHSVVDYSLLPTLVVKVPDQVFAIFTESGDPIAAVMGMLASPAAALGAILLAIATLRARVYPAWIAWLLLASPVITFIGNNFMSLPGAEPGPVLFYLALAGLGWSLLTERETSAAR